MPCVTQSDRRKLLALALASLLTSGIFNLMMGGFQLVHTGKKQKVIEYYPC